MKLSERLREIGFDSYAAYLQSNWWRGFNRAYRGRCRSACLVCGSADTQLHHVTYARVGRERFRDVVPLCTEHHDAVHVWIREQRLPVSATFDALAVVVRNSPAGSAFAADGNLIHTLATAWAKRERRFRANLGLAEYEKAGGEFNQKGAFRFLRELRLAGVEPAGWLACLSFARRCRGLGVCPSRLSAFLSAHWDAVKVQHSDEDTLTWAMERASQTWQKFAEPCPRLRRSASNVAYQKLEAVAYWLGSRDGFGKAFPFPRDRLAKWLGVSAPATGILVRELASRGAIVLSDAWSYKGRECREARYAGGGPR